MVVGIDYTEEYTQISYAIQGMKTPETVSISFGEKKYLIPSMVSKGKGNDEWLIGEEAFQSVKNGETCFFKNLLSKAVWDEVEFIEDTEYNYVEIFKIFAEEIIKILKRAVNNDQIEKIIFTIEKVNKENSDFIKQIFIDLGFSDIQIEIVSHSESLAYYILKQPKDIWTFDIVLFDFGSSYFIYRKLKVQGSKKPVIVKIEEEDLSEIMNAQTAEDDVFLKLLEERLSEESISSVYLNGIGFSGDWMTKSIEYICQGRRAFKGQNIFSKGACYGAMTSKLLDNSEYSILCNDRNKINISILIDEEGVKKQLYLMKAGENWYETGAKLEGFIDEDRKIQLIINNPFLNEQHPVEIDLSVFPIREFKKSRIEIVMIVKSEDEIIYLIKDLGFGDFFKGTNKIVEKTIYASDYA